MYFVVQGKWGCGVDASYGHWDKTLVNHGKVPDILSLQPLINSYTCLKYGEMFTSPIIHS